MNILKQKIKAITAGFILSIFGVGFTLTLLMGYATIGSNLIKAIRGHSQKHYDFLMVDNVIGGMEKRME